MANENRYYKTPFAESGDKTEVPNVSTGGAVGYDTGFGPDYELPQGTVNRKRIERDMWNGLQNGVTGNLKQWQEKLYPTWIEDNGDGVAFEYSEGMIVSHDNVDYVSLEGANQEEPGTGDKWSVKVSDINDTSQAYIFDTVAEYKASTITFPVGKTIHLLDRQAEFEVVAGTGTADEYEIIANTNTTQSAKLIITNRTDIRAFGVDVTNNVESSAALRAALRYNVRPSAGIVWIDPATPIIIDTSRNKQFVGWATDILEFTTTINDGSTLFQCSGQWHTVKDFSINTRTGTTLNYSGKVFGNQTDGTSFVRSDLKTKIANSGGTGLEVRGWLNDLNIFTVLNNRGFKGRELNANVMTLRSENDETGFDIEEIFGTTIDQLTIERITQQAAPNPSRIDNFRGLNIGSMYTEGGGWASNAITFGESVRGESIVINAGNITGVTDDGKPMLVFNQVGSVTANLDVGTGSNPVVVDFTENCDYVDSKVVGRYSTPDASRNKQFTQDNSLSVQIHANYSGDTYLDHGLSTFPTKQDRNVVVTEDSTIFRSGDKGIRITANAGTHIALTSLKRQISLFENTSKLAGKTIRAYAWVWVPDLPLFADRTIQPAFGIAARGVVESQPAAQRAMVAGQWNLVESEDLVVPSGWGGNGDDTIEFDFFVGNETETYPDNSYFIVVDSIFVTDVNADIRDIMQGRIRESAKYSGIKTDGNILTIQSQTYHSLTVPYINLTQGEVIVYREFPAAGGDVGYVCTTSGTLGGTAVFKAFGSIDP